MNRSTVLSLPRSVPPAAEVRRWTAGGLAALLAGVAVLLVWRRLAGALAEPLPLAPLALAGILWGVAAESARRAFRAASGAGRPFAYVGLLATLSVLTVAFGLSLSVSSTKAGALTVLWAGLFAFEAAGWRGALRDKRRRQSLPRGDLPLPADAEPGSPRSPGRFREPPRNDLVSHPPDTVPDRSVLQHWVRSVHPDGVESVRGVLRVSVAAGQRSASAHVVFCPPFPHAPRVEARAIAAPSLRIKTAQLAPFGARLDLKLADPAAEPTVIELHVEALGNAASHE